MLMAVHVVENREEAVVSGACLLETPSQDSDVLEVYSPKQKILGRETIPGIWRWGKISFWCYHCSPGE